MKLKKYRAPAQRRFKVLLSLVFIYLCCTVGYYFLPWSVRRPIYLFSPSIDRTLRRTGFDIVQGWDSLGLWGRDSRAIVETGHRDDHVYGGYPAGGPELTLLENKGYVVGYSDSLRNPIWVAYRVFDVPKLESGPRSSFRTDYRTESRVSSGAYKGSGYDRGHMAPNYAIASRYGRDGQDETFLMSNVVPQTPRLNRLIWKDLEMRVAKRYGQYFGEVWVITGPVFSEMPKRLTSEVAVPRAFYKILVDEKGGKLRVKAFLITNNCPPYERTKSHLVSVDRLEELTGLDFFPELPADAQIQLETKPAGRLWPWLGSAMLHR